MEIQLLAYPLPEWAVREDIESQMCELIYLAMMEVLPDNCPKEESDTLWRQAFKDRLHGGTCHVMFFHKGVLRGYLSYLVPDGKKLRSYFFSIRPTRL